MPATLRKSGIPCGGRQQAGIEMDSEQTVEPFPLAPNFRKEKRMPGRNRGSLTVKVGGKATPVVVKTAGRAGRPRRTRSTSAPRKPSQALVVYTPRPQKNQLQHRKRATGQPSLRMMELTANAHPVGKKRQGLLKQKKRISDEVFQIVAPCYASNTPYVLVTDDSNYKMSNIHLKQMMDIDWTTLSGLHQPVLGEELTGSTPLFKRVSSQFISLFFDPYVQAILRDKQPVGGSSVYTALFPDQVGGDGFYYGGKLYADYFSGKGSDEYHVKIGALKYLSGEPAYGPFHPVGDAGDSGARIFWVDQTAGSHTVPGEEPFLSRIIVTARLAFVGPDPSILEVVVRRWVGETEASDAIVTPITIAAADTPVTVTLYPEASGYHSVSLRRYSVASGVSGDFHPCGVTFEVTYDCRSTCVSRHITPPEYQQFAPTISNIRCCGSAALISNSVAEIAKGGVVHMAQVTGQKPWWHYSSAGVQEALANTNTANYQRLGWSKGAYTYVKPVPAGGGHHLSPLALQDSGVRDNFGPVLPAWRPLSPASYVVVEIVPPNINGNTPPGATQWPQAQSALVFFTSLTFVPQTQWMPASYPRDLNLRKVNNKLREAPQFMENETHWENLKRLVGQAVPYFPVIAGGLNLVGGIATADPIMAAMGAASLIQHFTQEPSDAPEVD